jgi:hypothetical protein
MLARPLLISYLIVVVAGCGDSGAVCGAGTHEVDGICVPESVNVDARPPTADASRERYDIRVAVSSIPADGHSKIPVLVIGTAADGSPALDQVVLNTTRAGAGTFSPPAVTLTPVGATVYFTPCSSTTAGCSARWADAGARRAADRRGGSPDVELVARPAWGSPAPCLVGGNVLFMDGRTNYIFLGARRRCVRATGAGTKASRY